MGCEWARDASLVEVGVCAPPSHPLTKPGFHVGGISGLRRSPTRLIGSPDKARGCLTVAKVASHALQAHPRTSLCHPVFFFNEATSLGTWSFFLSDSLTGGFFLLYIRKRRAGETPWCPSPSADHPQTVEPPWPPGSP